MALTIKENEGIFTVEGVVDSTTANQLKNHCEILLNTCGEVIIDLQHIASIDINGLLTLRALYTYAEASNMSFNVIGDGGSITTKRKKFKVAA
ncbi:STAS domain-containing protein [Winogradskyella sp. DF17]|jgi:anti-anti-sigma regulatory factor|uniref:STAS domain-containing protein n=1 Tax=Winogradskyella pelagia TaxID=2819984 RepID=A0ABS3T3S9_9FLAO|nr:STAS domain-containing protein [Winogradskyella sp. DF17]MBO3116395.1 STAS domain-containing protein [Winogradskyella sp. DF17]